MESVSPAEVAIEQSLKSLKSEPDIPSEILDLLLSSVVKFTGNSELTPSNVMTVVVNAMEQVVQFTELSGRKKKKAVLSTLKSVVQDDKTLWVLDNVAPSAIDLLIDTAKGRIKLNTIKKCCSIM